MGHRNDNLLLSDRIICVFGAGSAEEVGKKGSWPGVHDTPRPSACPRFLLA